MSSMRTKFIYFSSFFLLNLFLLPACFTKVVKKESHSLPVLKKKIRSPDPQERKAAIIEIRKYGAQALSTREYLRRVMIEDRHAEIRKAAMLTLIAMGPEAISDWIRGLVSDDPELKRIAEDQLNRLGQGDAKELAKSLRLPLDRVRTKILATLARLGKRAKVAIPELTQLLKHSEADVKIAAARALGQLGPDAAEAVLKLSDALRDNKSWWNVQVAIANALAKIGPAAAPAAQELAELLLDKDSEVGKAALAALKKIGPKAIPNLVPVLGNAPWQIKLQLAKLFAWMGEKAEKAVPALARATEDGDTEVKKAAIIALGVIGSKAQLGVPALKKILYNQNEDKVLWRETVLALVRIYPAGHKVLLNGLQGKDQPWLQQKIPEALGDLGARLGRHGVPLIVKALQNEMWQVRWTATMLLKKIRDQPKIAVPALIKALQDADPHVRKGAAKALGEYEEKAKSALPALKKLLEDKDPQVKAAAQTAISDITNE